MSSGGSRAALELLELALLPTAGTASHMKTNARWRVPAVGSSGSFETPAPAGARERAISGELKL